MAKRKIKVPVVVTKEEPESVWTKVKKFFNFSHNIVYNYAIGAVSTAMGIIAMVDWSPVMQLVQYGTGFTRNQLFWTAGVALLVAIGGYVTRVIGTKEVDGHLLPKAE